MPVLGTQVLYMTVNVQQINSNKDPDSVVLNLNFQTSVNCPSYNKLQLEGISMYMHA